MGTFVDFPLGHTTMTCPHKVATEHGVVPALHRNAKNPLEFVLERQLRPQFRSVGNLHPSCYSFDQGG